MKEIINVVLLVMTVCLITMLLVIGAFDFMNTSINDIHAFNACVNDYMIDHGFNGFDAQQMCR